MSEYLRNCGHPASDHSVNGCLALDENEDYCDCGVDGKTVELQETVEVQARRIAELEKAVNRLNYELNETGGEENCWCTEWWREHSDKHGHKCTEIKSLLASSAALLAQAGKDGEK